MLRLRQCTCLASRAASNYFSTSVSPAATESTVIVEKLDGEHEGIHVWRLNRAAVRNAISFDMIRQLRSMVEETRFDASARVVIISSSNPRMFCAGADLKERREQSELQYRRWSWSARQLSHEFSRLPVPTLAAIDGPALGGGAEVALSCDIRIAASNAVLGFPETSLAIIPGMGGTQRLPRLVGPAVAKELLFTARVLVAEEALQLGLVEHAVTQTEEGYGAYDKAREIASGILENGPVAIRMAKQAIDTGIDVDLQSGLAVEENCYAQVIPTKDRLEGLAAFKQKRKPRYIGE